MGGGRTLDQREFIELVFSEHRWRGNSSSGGMVWRCLFKAEKILGIRFPDNRSVNEDELFCVRVAKQCSSFLYISDALYFYRQRSTSLIKEVGFRERVLEGRRLCIDEASKISKYARLITVIAYIKEVLLIAKKTNQLLPIDLRKYEHDVQVAFRECLIGKKFLIEFWLFCKYRQIYYMYIHIRSIWKSVRF